MHNTSCFASITSHFGGIAFKMGKVIGKISKSRYFPIKLQLNLDQFFLTTKTLLLLLFKYAMIVHMKTNQRMLFEKISEIYINKIFNVRCHVASILGSIGIAPTRNCTPAGLSLWCRVLTFLGSNNCYLT